MSLGWSSKSSAERSDLLEIDGLVLACASFRMITARSFLAVRFRPPARPGFQSGHVRTSFAKTNPPAWSLRENIDIPRADGYNIASLENDVVRGIPIPSARSVDGDVLRCAVVHWAGEALHIWDVAAAGAEKWLACGGVSGLSPPESFIGVAASGSSGRSRWIRRIVRMFLHGRVTITCRPLIGDSAGFRQNFKDVTGRSA